MNENAIEIKGMKKHFNHFTLGPLDMTIPTGCMVGLIGENGAGKSTTIKLILGLLRRDAGTIRVLGQSVDELDTGIKNRIGVVFDELHLPGELLVRQAGRFCHLLFSNWDQEQFEACRQQFQLPLTQKISQLSRGMRMQLSIAIALSHHADLLILDEATSGLDPIVRDEILNLLLDYLQNPQHTVLISSHILSDLEKAADYIAFLHQGRLLLMDGKDALRERYGLCSLDNKTMTELDPGAIVGRRSHAFGQDLLVERSLIPPGIKLDKPSIEDIMIFMIKGEAE